MKKGFRGVDERKGKDPLELRGRRNSPKRLARGPAKRTVLF